MKPLYIGTKSKARISLLRGLGLEFNVISIDFKEVYSDDPIATVKINSIGKYLSNAYRIDGILATFDTIVYKDGQVIGKPKDRNDAYKVLKLLSGDFHDVYTGLTIGYRDEYIFDYEVTRVYFDELNEDLINWYLDSREYRYSAGAYSIQGLASIFIRRIEGCYYNVVGLPINKFIKMMKKFGINILNLIK